MTSAKTAKKRMLDDKALMESLENLAGVEGERGSGLLLMDAEDESFEAIAVERDRNAATEKPKTAKGSDYWRKACMSVCRKLKTANKRIDSLNQALNAMKFSKDSWQKEAENLRGKLEVITKDAK